MAETEPTRPEPGPDAGIDDIQADIEHTRNELGETVEALSDKLDFKGRAQDKAAETKERITQKTHQTKDRVLEATQRMRSGSSVKPVVPVAAIAVAVAVIVGIVVWTRRR
jgi:ADP-ribosylglycohydrolase